MDVPSESLPQLASQAQHSTAPARGFLHMAERVGVVRTRFDRSAGLPMCTAQPPRRGEARSAG
jgi:hypothetical protein